MTEQEIIDSVYGALTSGNPNPGQLKNQLEMYNQLGGGIDAHGNPI
jgi:hypothetical protein